MSKMDRQLNSKKDKETIYEIYRACRLCGAGAGYKMPIIQNVLDMDDSDVELRQKVRDCVQIEVHQDDKMPPLICELCVDKVNDFYEFLEMCRQTNKRTRLRLGLPPQSMPRGAPDAGECILGLTEPVYVNDDSDGESMSKRKKPNTKVKVKREPELKVKLENRILTESRLRFSRRDPTPPRLTRQRTNSKEDNLALSRLKDGSKSSPKATPKSILKKETKNEDNSLLTPRLKRSRDKEPVKLEKRVKIARKPSPQPSKSSPKSSPRITTRLTKSPKVSTKRAPSPPPRLHKCLVCGQGNKTPQAHSSHMRVHCVGFISPRLACNPCGTWFVTVEEAAAHHRHHRNKKYYPYTCKRCTADFKHLSAYDDHFGKNQCIPFHEVPDVKCEVCWHLFPTNKLLEDHKCLGEEHRPGGKCSKCKRSYTLLKNLKKHEPICTAKKKGESKLDPVLLGQVRPIQIRVSRCDRLLTNLKQEHYDVSNVTADFGLDKNCVYPYISSVSSVRIKSDPDELDRMVDIKDEIKDEFYIEEDYVHWDSEDSESDEEVTGSLVPNPYAKKKKIDTLANLTLKTLFSKRCLGKVPKKRRRVKQEKNMFDSLLAGSEDDVTRDINNIIGNLGDDDDEFEGQNQKGDGDSQKGDDIDRSMAVSDDRDTNVDEGEKTKNVVDKSVDVVDNDTDVVNKKNNYDVSIADNNDSSEKTEQNPKKTDVIDSINEKNDKNNDDLDDEASKEEQKDIGSAIKNFNSVCKESEGSNHHNSLSSSDIGNNDDLTRINDKVNNGTINNISFDYIDGEVLSKNENGSKVNDVPSEVSKDENENDGVESEEKNYDLSTYFENSQDSNSVGAVSESLLNDNTQSDVSESEKETIDRVNTLDNATLLSEPSSDVNENKSQTEGFSNERTELDDTKSNDTSQTNEEQSNYSQSNDNINDNDYKNAISVIVNSDKTKVPTDSEEMDDSKLMEALDAEIGESNENSREHINDKSGEQMNDNFNEKNALQDLIAAKSSEIDINPEDFNFDA